MTSCTYTTCQSPATHVWERTPEELILLSQKRQYRALMNAETTVAPSAFWPESTRVRSETTRSYRPRKMGKGRPLAVFFACDDHVPRWRRDVFVPITTEAELPDAA